MTDRTIVRHEATLAIMRHEAARAAGSGFLNQGMAVVALAQQAGCAIMRHYNRRGEDGEPHSQAPAMRAKPDGSPVTVADLASDAILCAGLAALPPHWPVVSEEQPPPASIADFGKANYWCVDPLDGTREYLSRTGEFCVCIAGISQARAVFGVIYAPIARLTYATLPEGAMMRQADGPWQRLACRAAPPGPVLLVSRRGRGARLESWLNSQKEPGLEDDRAITRHIMGSAIKFGLLAAAQADFYPRFGPSCEWDTAAGQAIVEAAGGTVTDLAGEPLRYGKPGFLNPGFLARGRPHDKPHDKP